MGRIRKYLCSFALAAAVFSTVLAGGCGSKEQDPGKTETEAPVREQTGKAEQKSTQDIPDELLPGGTGTEEERLELPGNDDEEQEQTESVRSYQGGSSKSGASQSEDRTETSGGQEESTRIQVSVSVDSSIVGNLVSYSDRLTLEKGATAYDGLVALVGNQVSGDSSYVTGIAGLSEKDYGPKSGWMYWVNGVAPNKACGGYTLQDGDELIWRYTK